MFERAFISDRLIAVGLTYVDADAVIQQFYPGELGGLALAEIVFGAANPSGAVYQGPSTV